MAYCFIEKGIIHQYDKTKSSFALMEKTTSTGSKFFNFKHHANFKKHIYQYRNMYLYLYSQNKNK